MISSGKRLGQSKDLKPGRPELVVLALLNETACEDRRGVSAEPFFEGHVWFCAGRLADGALPW